MKRLPIINLLNWRDRGYHNFPISQEESDIPPEMARLWADFQRLLEEAKRGIFTNLEDAIALYDDADSWTIAYAYIQLLGDAAPSSCLSKIKEIAEALIDPQYQVDLCDVLATSGSLSTIPLLLTSWEQLDGYEDRERLPELIGQVLEVKPGCLLDPSEYISSDAYKSHVLDIYNDLVKKIGNVDAIVWHGEIFTITYLAEYMLNALADGQFETPLRRKFEAITGVDCSQFYDQQVLQPIAAAAIIEDFLDSGETVNYMPGLRYFFGHLIEG